MILKAYIKRSIFLLGIATIAAGGMARAGAASSAGALPAEISSFVDRRSGCEHWGGEEAYDDARGREIDAAMKKLDCVDIERDQARLRKRYAHSPAVLKILAQAPDE
jgi:hypothetical protein